MLSVLNRAHKSLGHIVIAAASMVLAACVPAAGPTAGGGGAASGKVQVALLVPGGSGQASDELLARSLQNAARLAITDLGGAAKVDLRVYNTAGQPAQAAAMATKAVAEGAQIILGPVFAQEANAAGVAVAASGVNVLAFSNNPDIAGNNVFVLGPTFGNTAGRLATYAVRQGKSKIMIVHDRNTAGEQGRAAIASGVAAAGGQVVSTGSYEFSQNGVMTAAPGIASAAKSSGAQAVFLTADTAGALPLVSQLLADNGLSSASAQFIGLTRWDIPAATLALPGVQGGWFALPDPAPWTMPAGPTRTVPLIALAWGRSGDKGDLSNIGLIARRPEWLPLLWAQVTPEVVKAWFAHLVKGRVDRFHLPGLHAMNLVMHQALEGGGPASLRLDPLGKGMAQMLLELPVQVPADWPV